MGGLFAKLPINRRWELAELHRAADILKKGSTHYLALLGQRKVGKTSLMEHFAGELRTKARRLLTELSARAGSPIPRSIVDRLIELVGTNPFYLQVLGSELCAKKTVDEDAVKVVLQETLFSSDGRLWLYFARHVERIVGRSASLERTLIELAANPGTLTEVAERLGVGTGTLKSWINRVADLVSTKESVYHVTDPALRLWLSTKSHLGPMLPTLVLGDEAEKAVARKLAALGFELVYQSRGSRGAFDLLAILHASEIGVQVKRVTLPYHFDSDECNRMKHWAKRLGWTPVLALWADGETLFYDVRRFRKRGKPIRIDQKTKRITDVLSFLLAGG